MIRKAKIQDISQIQALINAFAKQDLMLPKSLNEIYENLRDFWVAEKTRKIVGCAALRVCWGDLAEVKSLAVALSEQKKGLGKELILRCLAEAKQLGVKKVFVLTYQPDYFRKFGFRKVENSSLPHKVWAECINCPKFPNCQETALVKNL